MARSFSVISGIGSSGAKRRLNAAIAAFYYLRLIAVMYLEPAADRHVRQIDVATAAGDAGRAVEGAKSLAFSLDRGLDLSHRHPVDVAPAAVEVRQPRAPTGTAGEVAGPVAALRFALGGAVCLLLGVAFLGSVGSYFL